MKPIQTCIACLLRPFCKAQAVFLRPAATLHIPLCLVWPSVADVIAVLAASAADSTSLSIDLQEKRGMHSQML